MDHATLTTHTGRSSHPAPSPRPARSPQPARLAPNRTASTRGSDPRADADGMAVASFVLGLIGLLLFNLVFGPCAIVLAGLALARGTGRRGRALLGLTLGIADLVVLAVLVTVNDAVFWHFGG
ncbi:DUF4190 domain-containing protein [Streptomyces sp. SAJ15]|uniref:DUF4190 domain-containing protein n=1 Tax=Streptomyces sp. SAJ15 TaxID=2011095 RepID=UPI0021B3365D|nr:DUF4190 domain-containing protein [Streptomyces sp. SAJ15]